MIGTPHQNGYASTIRTSSHGATGGAWPITILPLVNWPERGLYAPGNTAPRWHIVWGTGYEIIRRLLDAPESHPRRANLLLLFDTEVSAIEMTSPASPPHRRPSSATRVTVE